MAATLTLDDTSFDATIQADAMVLVDFGAIWCAPCRALEPIVHDVAGEYLGRVRVATVDVDASPTVAARYGIRSVPTMLFFRGGRVIDTIVGIVPKRHITERLDAHIAEGR